MKRCPRCGRNYNDDSMSFCLDDGSELLFGPANSNDLGEPRTAILRDVEMPDGAPEEKTAVLRVPVTGSTNRASRKKVVLTGVFIALLIASGVFAGYRYLNSPVKQIESIAVMPFVNDSGNADVEYLSDGMTETLINSLSQIPNLSVKARSSVFRYKGQELDPRKVADELHVQAILTGHIVQRGEQITLNLELIDAQTENAIWGDRYERRSSDIVSLQSEIARDVSRKLKSKLSDADDQKIAKKFTADPEAYELYLKGNFYSNKRTAEGLKEAAEFYKQATEKDPSYALAYAALAETYVAFPGFEVASANDAMPLAKAAALRAIELDDSLAEAHTALGDYLIIFEFDLGRSEKEYRQAIELKPNSALAHKGLAQYLTVVKRFDEAVAELKLADELDPLSPDVELGATLVFARRYDEAIAQLKHKLVLDPDSSIIHSYLGWAYGSKGLFTAAVSEMRTAVSLNSSYFLKGYLALWLARAGNTDEALKIRAELEKAARDGFVRPSTLAVVYIGLGEKDKALDEFEKEVSSRTFNAIYLGVLPEADGLRSEPRFKALLRKMNLPE